MAYEDTISGGSIQSLAESTGALARQGFPSGGATMYFGGDTFYYHPPEGTPGYDGMGWEFQDKELLAKVKKDKEDKKKTPPPTAANPAPPEGIPDNSEAIAVCLAPDVCKTPIGSSTPPIPYQVYELAGDDGNYSPDVFYNGYRAMRFDSLLTTTYGDEPGVAKGVKSGTVGDIVEPTSHSPIVRINGKHAIRHRDNCTLNKGNCPGEFIFVKSTETQKAPDGNNQSEAESKGDSRGAGERFADGFSENAGETWEGLKQVGAQAWDGTKELASALVTDPTGTVAAGAGDLWSGVKGAANWAGEVATNLLSDPSATLGRGKDNMFATGGAIWHGIADPYSEAYAEGGLAQAVGHGSFDVVKLGVEALLTKGAATAAGKAASAGAAVAKAADKADDAADAVKKAKEAEEAAKKAKHLKEAEESGREGVRITSYKRPSGYRKGVRDKVWEEAKDDDGKVRDPITRREIEPSEKWDMGHKPGYEFRKHQQSAAERGISRQQFLDEHNNPSHYRPELPSSNRAHAGELKTGDWLGQ